MDYCAIAPLLASFRLQQRTTIASYIADLEVLINLRNVVHVLVDVDDVTMSEEIISINQSFYCALVQKVLYIAHHVMWPNATLHRP